jgi:hypothetical protein
MTTTFAYDRSELLPVEKSDSYTVAHNDTEYTIYKVGDWSFEDPEDSDPEDARQAALAWIAWYEYLTKQD